MRRRGFGGDLRDSTLSVKLSESCVTPSPLGQPEGAVRGPVVWGSGFSCGRCG